MVHDDKAAALAELSHISIRRSLITYITPPVKILAPISGTLGCSFLLMEEMWRDCKTVYLGSSNQELLDVSQKNALAAIVNAVVTNPCDAMKIVDAMAVDQFKKRLGCGQGQREYVVTLAYLFNGQQQVLNTLNGVIK